MHGDPGRRNVPGLANVAWAQSLTWADPRTTNLERQALIPVLGTTPVEMGMQGQEVELAKRLGRNPCYRRMFVTAFPDSQGRIDMPNIARALAAFQRTIISSDSPWDRSRAGNANVLSVEARRGEVLFRSRGCIACHQGPNLTDNRFHRIGETGSDRGLGEVTGDPADDGRFRTPGLRNVALTAPYLHDGSAPDLRAVISSHRDAPPLSAFELGDMIAFLSALTDQKLATDPRFALPDRACGKRL